MQQHSFRRAAALGAVLALSLALAGCGGAKATPIVIHVTPSPSPTEAATLTAAAATTEAPASSPTDTPAASPSPSPTPTPPPAGTTCSRTAANNQWFVDQAPHLSWSVYCAVLPSGWSLISGSSEYNNGGYVTVAYQGPGGTLTLYEGNICYFMKSGCASAGTDLGAATFGDRTGKVWNITPTSYEFSGDGGTNVTYRADSSGLSEATFRSYLAAMHKV